MAHLIYCTERGFEFEVEAESLSFDDITSTVLIDMDSVIDGLIESRQECEQSCIDVGEVIIRKLEKFLNTGICQFGLRKEDGSVLSDARQWPEPITDGCSASWSRSKEKMSPIIWFGMQDNAPLECWSLTLDAKMSEQIDCDADSSKNQAIERWKPFWFCSFWSFDWNELFDHCGDTYIFWMFFENDLDEPSEELDEIRKSYPIFLASCWIHA